MAFFDLSRSGDSGDLAGEIRDLASIGTDAIVVTAVRTSEGTLKLVNWQVGFNGTYHRIGDSGDQAGETSSLDIALFGRFVVACRDSNGKLKLISWDVSTAGPITRLKDSGAQPEEADRIKIVSLRFDMFVVAFRAGNGRLTLITWRLNSDGSFTRLKSGSAAEIVGEIDMVEVAASGTDRRVVTAVREGGSNLKLIVWRISPDGTLVRLSDSGTQGGEATLIRVVKDQFNHVVTAVRASTGNLKLISWLVSADGTSITFLRQRGHAGIEDSALLALADGLVSAVRTTDGNLQLISWQVSASGVITRRGDSGSQAGNARLINLVRGPGFVGGLSVTMITPVQDSDDDLKLINWGPSCLGVHVKILTQPNIPISTMITSMRQVYAAAGITVNILSTEILNLPLLNDIDVGGCDGPTTTEQNQLFANRNNVGAGELVVYFVRSTVPAFNGCASHPAGRPGAVVARIASQWTMAHEVGHVLGLAHVDTPGACLLNRLMTGCGTALITNPPPDLVAREVGVMQGSNLTQAC
jgi:hypothetical protein